MGIRTGMNAPAVLIEKYINSAYDNVKLVADNIESVVILSENIGINSDSFVTNADNIESIVLLANVENIDKLGEKYQYVEIVADDLVGTHSSILEMGDVSDTVDPVTGEDSYIKTVAENIININLIASAITSGVTTSFTLDTTTLTFTNGILTDISN